MTLERLMTEEKIISNPKPEEVLPIIDGLKRLYAPGKDDYISTILLSLSAYLSDEEILPQPFADYFLCEMRNAVIEAKEHSYDRSDESFYEAILPHVLARMIEILRKG